MVELDNGSLLAYMRSWEGFIYKTFIEGTKKVIDARINRRAELLSTRKEKDFFHGVYETEGKPVLILNLGKILSKEDK